MPAKVKNVTFSLPSDIIEKIKEYAKDKYIPSLNAGIKEALEDYSKKIEKIKLKNEMMEASRDPLFMKDLEESMKLFEISDAEVIGRKNEW